VNRTLKRTLIVLIVVVGLLVGADYALAAAAEYQVSKRMKADLGLSTDPSVNIHGFPFITQALAGDYSDITVDAVDVPVKDTLRDLDIAADLRHVRVGLSDLLSGNVRQINVDEVDGQVTVKASDIGRLLNLPDLTITPVSLDTVNGQGSQDKAQATQDTRGDTTTAGVQLTATVNIAGVSTQVNVYGIIALDNGGIAIRPKTVQLVNNQVSAKLPEALLNAVLPAFSTTLNSKSLPLPFTVQATGVQVQNGAIVLQGRATNVSLNTAAVSG
jgi:LmeA-like phospholipid-binding